MKKTLVLGVALVLVLAGCGQGVNNNPQGDNMEGGPQSGADQQQAPSQPQGQQQTPPQSQGQDQQKVSLNDQADTALSQGKELMEQYGEFLEDDEKSELEDSLGDLEDLSKQEEIDPKEFQSVMEEVQKNIQPMSEAVKEQRQQPGGGQQ